MSDQRVFLGWVDPVKVKPGPLVVPVDGHLAATWPYGPGGAPGMVVVGTPGGGKSSLLRMIELGLVRPPGKREVCIIDGEGSGEHTMFARAANVTTVLNVNEAAYPGSVAKAAKLLEIILEEVIRRDADLTRAQEEAERTRRTPAYQPPPDLFVVIDGWMSLGYDIGKTLSPKARERAVGVVLQIARLGRKVGVHVVLAMHRPDARSMETGLPGELKSLLAVRIAAVGPLGMRKVEADMIFDDSTAKDRIPRELGGCLMQIGGTEVPFVVPPMTNPTTADPSVDDAARQVVWRRVPLRSDVA